MRSATPTVSPVKINPVTDGTSSSFPRAWLAITLLLLVCLNGPPAVPPSIAVHDVSPPLATLRAPSYSSEPLACAPHCGMADDPDDDVPQQPTGPLAAPAGADAIEQTAQGARPPAPLVASFDGLGEGFDGPQGPTAVRNPSDNSLAVGPEHVVEIVNSRLAIFSRAGKPLYGAVATNTIFQGFGGPCEERNNGDAVVRYDQLADRWLVVMPIFNAIIGRPGEPYAMCYALSETADPLGSYYRYEFRRKLFPDYPRPAIWPDGYYVASSSGDNVIQKHACVVDRVNMLKGRDATEQCLVVEGVNFLNNADLDGQKLPPTGAPNIVMAAGGSQLRRILEDDALYAWQFHVDWTNPAKTRLDGPLKIAVAPYHYLCDGQLTRCVPQPASDIRLDAQGDKIMQRLVYRNFGDHESLVAVHSVNTSAGGGGVRWYEFRLNAGRDPVLFQQGTYAPDRFFRWMASPAMDRAGNIAIGYSFGGDPHYAGQRFAARMAADAPGLLTLHETILAEGGAAQTDGNRWEDYATTAMDPVDDCTMWYAGDYYKPGAARYSTRIGAFRLPGCREQRVSGTVYFDANHNGRRDPTEPGIAGVPIRYRGARSGVVVSGWNGAYSLSLPADPAFQSPDYTLAMEPSRRAGWSALTAARAISLTGDAAVEFAAVCTVTNRGGEPPEYWWSARGRAVLAAHSPGWMKLLNEAFHVDMKSDRELKEWLALSSLQAQRAATMLNIAYGKQDDAIAIHDLFTGEWLPLRDLMAHVQDARYSEVLRELNDNRLPVTPSNPLACGSY